MYPRAIPPFRRALIWGLLTDAAIRLAWALQKPGETMSDLAARREAGLRRQGRAQDDITESEYPAGHGFRGLFGRGGAPDTPRGWKLEAPTEFELGRQLMSLDARYTVLRAFDFLGELDADFVVVGPAGIFLITTRTRSAAKIWVDKDMLWVNGLPTDQVRDARNGAERASARLSIVMGQDVRAIPVITVMSPLSLSFGGDPAQRVVTLPADLVVQWLSECSRKISDDAVDSLVQVVEKRATWGSLPGGSGVLARVH